MAAEEEDTDNESLKHLGVMFLCAVAGYGLAQYQQTRRASGQICYTNVTDTHTLPDLLADKAEAVIRAGGQAGVRKVGALLELVVQTATGDTQIFRQALDSVNQAKNAYAEPQVVTQASSVYPNERHRSEAENVEFFDKATGTWRSM
jgi:hypothetical protein